MHNIVTCARILCMRKIKNLTRQILPCTSLIATFVVNSQAFGMMEGDGPPQIGKVSSLNKPENPCSPKGKKLKDLASLLGEMQQELSKNEVATGDITALREVVDTVFSLLPEESGQDKPGNPSSVQEKMQSVLVSSLKKIQQVLSKAEVTKQDIAALKQEVDQVCSLFLEESKRDKSYSGREKGETSLEEETVGFPELPFELYPHIFHHLGSRGLRDMLSLTKDLAPLVREAFFHKLQEEGPIQLTLSGLTTLCGAATRGNYNHLIKAIELKSDDGELVTDEIVMRLAQFTSLGTLSLDDANIRANNLQDLPKSITKLYLRHARLPNFQVLSGLTHLTELDLNYAIIRDNDLQNLPKSLRILNLYGCRNLTGPSTLLHLDFSALSELTELTTLDLGNNNITLEDLQGLPKSLRILNLQECDGTMSVSALLGLTNLTTLNLKDTHIRDISTLSELTHLTELDLTGCASVTNKTLKDLPKGIVILELNRCNKITSISALNDFPNLIKLSLVRCVNITNRTLKGIPNNLRKLKLVACHNVTQSGITKLQSRLPELKIKR